jgi:hypothetical protein
MTLFHCDNCGNALFFENVKCLHCGSELAFLPGRMAMTAIEPVPDSQDLWRRKKPGKQPSVRHFRLCQNNTQQQACNFALPDSDPNPLCVCCRLTQVLPDLSVPGNHERWYRIEFAKRSSSTRWLGSDWCRSIRPTASATDRSSSSWPTCQDNRS